MLNASTMKIESEFQTFIQPTIHPKLTPFCIDLTSITQNEINQAPLYAEAIKRMNHWMRDYPDSLFCSWGDYDRKQFQKDCKAKEVPYPFPEEHMNLKKEFSIAVHSKKRFGLAAALKYLKLDFQGTHHRGIDDAKNIAHIVQALTAEKFSSK